MLCFLITSHPADVERSIAALKLEQGLFAVVPPLWTEPPTDTEIQMGLYVQTLRAWKAVDPFEGEIVIREYRRADGGGRTWGIASVVTMVGRA